MKPSKAYVIGVDSGTSSTRAILFDEKGEALAEGRQAYDVLRPQPGWVEQKAQWWWDAFVGSVRNLLANCSVKPSEIQSLAITHQRITAVPVDKSMEPVRNAILWNDIRCSEQNEWALEKVGRQQIYQRTGYNPGIWTVYKAMWLRDKEPDVYDRMHKFLLVQDYLTYQLTGALVTTSSAAVMTGCLDARCQRRDLLFHGDLHRATAAGPRRELLHRDKPHGYLFSRKFHLQRRILPDELAERNLFSRRIDSKRI